jgi:hypothetical protein
VVARCAVGQEYGKRELPQSMRGRHAKVKSPLDDPVVAAELRTYLCSNKWAMNPGKLAQFLKNELIPSTADKYLCQIICDEMPWGIWSMNYIHKFI